MTIRAKWLFKSGEPIGKRVDPIGVGFGPLQPLLDLLPFLGGKLLTLGPASYFPDILPQ